MKTETHNGLEMFNRTGRAHDWCCVFPRRDYEQQKVRWGTREEISGDIDHFVAYGTLPKVPGISWA